MTKAEAIEYIRSCGEGDGPEDRTEAAEIFEAIFGREPDAELGHFEIWSHACSAALVAEVEEVKTAAAAAIERSQSHNEIVHVEWPRPVVMIEALRQAAYALDGVDFDDVDTGEAWECWAFSEDAPEGEMLWRVHVKEGGAL